MAIDYVSADGIIKIKGLEGLQKKLFRFEEVVIYETAEGGPQGSHCTGYALVSIFMDYGGGIRNILEDIQKTQPLTGEERSEVERYRVIGKVLLEGAHRIKLLPEEKVREEGEKVLDELVEITKELNLWPGETLEKNLDRNRNRYKNSRFRRKLDSSED